MRRGLLAALLACAAPDAPAPVAAPPLRPDDLHRFALAWTVDAGDADGGAHTGGLELRGELALQAIAARPDGTLIATPPPRLAG